MMVIDSMKGKLRLDGQHILFVVLHFIISSSLPYYSFIPFIFSFLVFLSSLLFLIKITFGADAVVGLGLKVATSEIFGTLDGKFLGTHF